MKKLLLTAAMTILAQPAFAGRSLDVLTCHGEAMGIGPIDAKVFYEVKAGVHGEFGDFLGFQARTSAQDNDEKSFYCFGACTLVKREIVGDEINVRVLDRSLVSPQLDQRYVLTVPSALTSPGVQATARITVDLSTYAANPSLVTVSADLRCTSGEGASFLLKSGR